LIGGQERNVAKREKEKEKKRDSLLTTRNILTQKKVGRFYGNYPRKGKWILGPVALGRKKNRYAAAQGNETLRRGNRRACITVNEKGGA